MSNVTSRKAAFLPLLALIAAVSLAAPAIAQTASPPAPSAAKVAPGSPALTTAKPASARTYSSPERVDARIAELHAKLSITAAQEPQWITVAGTMRGNASAMEQAADVREKALKTMTVMDDLRSYEGMAAAHADGLHKLVAAFGPLYDSMSPEQKKAADNEFQGYRKRGTIKK